ncbi:MAG TPA: putative toxin-antitoxin system toxin component, PIN family [Solirubrobacterales bacterium]|nr:putative toxin-antitoxin system toxin component, PIN family [Solirubrobacterales bacterium]
MRAILDPNVIISALLSREGTPAKVLRAWLEGRFELIVSPLLLEELRRALAYPKVAERIKSEDASALIDWLRREGILVDDPPEPPTSRSEDPGDDYLLALTEAERAVLVSGDRHLLALTAELPVLTPREFLVNVGGR